MWFSGGAQAICEGFQDRVMMAGDELGLEHHMPEQSPTAAYGTRAPHRAAVVGNGRKAGERGDLFAVDLPKFWHLRDQHCACNGADPRNGTQDVSSRKKGSDAGECRILR